ncbi:MAG: A/G-specific adenine glycosylase [Acidimicrobiaceae bacterium]|nr:A/G-specific adenine glycosylase [Acidimicrobiaceae bacterium]
MLQQTQVARVVSKYEVFLARFPTPAACAAAPPGDVVRAWAGLGYNRRAINLHRAAVAVVDHHAGRLPVQLDELLALPGIGPYTARAVLAFAYEADVAVLDVNARRVLARAFSCADQSGADRLVPPGRGWDWNSAVLDLGATVCTSRAPRCGACPLVRSCAWAVAGYPQPDPARRTARQSRFDGSDRQGRGRLVDALRLAPVAVGDLAAVMGWPDDQERAARVAGGVVADGLAVSDGEKMSLP